MYTNTVDQPTAQNNDVTELTAGYQPTPTEVDAAEQLAAYEIVLRYGAKPSPDSEGPSGRRFRWAGYLEVHPAAQRIIVRLREDAHERDLHFLGVQLRRLLTGHWSGLNMRERRAKSDGRVWHDSLLGYTNDMTLGAYIIPCGVEACTGYKGHHTASVPGDEWHETEVTEHRDGWYGIKAVKHHDEPWLLDMHTDGDLDAWAVRDLLNDVAWTQGTIDRLNAAAAAAEVGAELDGGAGRE